MKRSHVLLASIIATLLLAAPAQSHAFCCGFFGGGFGFGFGGGWSGWGGPGWWGPGYWGGPAYWHRPYYHHVRYHDRFWSDPVYGLGRPRVAPPPAQAPESTKQK